jgi:hypothetical protein
MTAHMRASQKVRAKHGIVNSTDQRFHCGNGKGPVMIAEPKESLTEHKVPKSLSEEPGELRNKK